MQLRLSAFGLLIEGPKTTQLFSVKEFQWFRQFISRDTCNPNAAFRQQFSSHVKKVIVSLFCFLLAFCNFNVSTVGFCSSCS